MKKQLVSTGVVGTRDLIFRLYIISISGEAEKVSIARGEINYLAAAYLICVPPPPPTHTKQGYLESSRPQTPNGCISGHHPHSTNILLSKLLICVSYYSTVDSLLYKSTKYKKNAGQHPGFYRSQPLCLGCVGGDGVEDVDQHQEQGDQERHPTGDHVHGDEK